jgi:HSP20 family protein
MTLVRWNPARELASMEIDRLNHMFNTFFVQGHGSGSGWLPLVDIYETDEHEFVLKAELPEIRREDIAVTFDNNVLTLSGERKSAYDSNSGTLHRSERQYGSFSRSFTLPSTVDGNQISASYKDGILTVRLLQREEAKPKQITVNG